MSLHSSPCLQLLAHPMSKHQEMIQALQRGFGDSDQAAAIKIITTYPHILDYNPPHVESQVQQLMALGAPERIKKLLMMNPAIVNNTTENFKVCGSKTLRSSMQSMGCSAASANDVGH